MTQEALKMALYYLEQSDNYLGSLDHSKPIAAIKEALAQPHETTLKEFNQWIHDDPNYHIWVKEREDRFKPELDALQVLANENQRMAKRIEELEALAQEQEPVAWMFQHDETGRMNYVSNDGVHNPTIFLEMNPRYALVCPLYTTPPQRTEKKI